MVDQVGAICGVTCETVGVYNMFATLAVPSVARLAEFGCFCEYIVLFMHNPIIFDLVTADHVLDVGGSAEGYHWCILE